MWMNRGKARLARACSPRFNTSILTMVGSFWDFRLFGEVWASGLHAQFVVVKMHLKDVWSFVYALPDYYTTDYIDRIAGKSIRTLQAKHFYSKLGKQTRVARSMLQDWGLPLQQQCDLCAFLRVR